MLNYKHYQRYIYRRPSMPACLGCWAMGTNYVKKCTVRKINLLPGLLEQPKQDQNLFYRNDESNESTKEESLSFVLFKSSFTSVSTAGRGHPSLSLSS